MLELPTAVVRQGKGQATNWVGHMFLFGCSGWCCHSLRPKKAVAGRRGSANHRQQRYFWPLSFGRKSKTPDYFLCVFGFASVKGDTKLTGHRNVMRSIDERHLGNIAMESRLLFHPIKKVGPVIKKSSMLCLWKPNLNIPLITIDVHSKIL